MIGIVLLCLSGSFTIAQVDTTKSATYLVEEILLGSGVLIGNVKFTGEKHAIGVYEDSTSQLGIKQGIILTSGNAYYILGPNKTPRSGWASNAPGDEDLNKIARGKTYDASILEFDFVTMSENLSFEFVFASEEYLEYVGSKFNDVFAFFVTTPSGEQYNIATLPDGETPITVNTVNNELNSQFYLDNAYINVTDPFIWDVRNRKVITNENYQKEEQPPQYFTQFDGFTTVLQAKATVIPNEVYHIKIAISDVGDGILDSGVFLKAGTFSSSGRQVVEVDDHFNKKIPAPEFIEKTKAQEIASINTRSIDKKIAIANVEFEFDKALISQKGASTIQYVFNQWMEAPEKEILIKGHTDNFGSDHYNMTLSQRRAEAVANMLRELGVSPNKITIQYFGESQPLQSNNHDFGRARNRRVEFVLRD